ncbi:LytTR family transcriptional regulator [Flavobacterium zepuense]|uniref:LytTR family transcriptional regulator n=1 Tax=Flavobacterium zepuense TaxID=2593302 RepID=A0A552UUN1_9FLAO|nr:LytTR family transcriptional regulator DNA-binding domain-containing protein [Flavobacterium zepuense]TRW21936.1 LytTR family transcriptional regulator [Flavobacterium zepuense]
MENVDYKNKPFLVMAAIAAAIYSCLHGRWSEIDIAIRSWRFYFALIISLFIALVLVFFVHNTSIRLDAKYSWRNHFLERVSYQICLGIFVAAFIDFLFISVYFLAIGQNVWYNGYFRSGLPVVMILLFLLNCYYWIHYLMLTSKSKEFSSSSEEKQTEEMPSEDNSYVEPLLEGVYRGQSFCYRVSRDVLYFYREEKFVRFVTMYDDNLPLAITIESLADKYAEAGIYQVSRGVLINCRIIEGYQSESRDKLTIIIQQQYLSLIQNLSPDFFSVTKKYIESFKKQFGENKAGKQQ